MRYHSSWSSGYAGNLEGLNKAASLWLALYTARRVSASGAYGIFKQATLQENNKTPTFALQIRAA